MNRCCFKTRRRTPRHWTIERPVHFEDAGTILVPPEFAFETAPQTFIENGQQLPRSQVEEDASRSRQSVERFDARARDDLTAQTAQVRRHRVRNVLRTAARNGPAISVAQRQEHQTKRSRAELIERQTRVRRSAGEERTCAVLVKSAPHKTRRQANPV